MNNYLSAHGATAAAPLLRKCAAFVTKILRVLGVVEGGDELGFPLQGVGEGSAGAEDLLRPYLDTFRDFRTEARATHRHHHSE